MKQKRLIEEGKVSPRFYKNNNQIELGKQTETEKSVQRKSNYEPKIKSPINDLLKKWSKSETEKLVQVVNDVGLSNWKLVSQIVGNNRTS